MGEENKDSEPVNKEDVKEKEESKDIEEKKEESPKEEKKEPKKEKRTSSIKKHYLITAGILIVFAIILMFGNFKDFSIFRDEVISEPIDVIGWYFDEDDSIYEVNQSEMEKTFKTFHYDEVNWDKFESGAIGENIISMANFAILRSYKFDDEATAKAFYDGYVGKKITAAGFVNIANMSIADEFVILKRPILYEASVFREKNLVVIVYTSERPSSDIAIMTAERLIEDLEGGEIPS